MCNTFTGAIKYNLPLIGCSRTKVLRVLLVSLMVAVDLAVCMIFGLMSLLYGENNESDYLPSQKLPVIIFSS